jgi:hypothetical protein
MANASNVSEVADLLRAIADSEMTGRELNAASEFLALFTDDTYVGDVRAALNLYYSL